MAEIRAARPFDAPEIVRLRRIMFTAMHGRDERGPWEGDAEEAARRQLTGPRARMAGFVVDGDSPGEPHLAACALGRLEERLPSPSRPVGRIGFVFNVCTDPRYRGHGFARSTTEALLGWFAEQGVTRVDLHCTDEAEELYRSLGFTERATALSLELPATG